MIRYLYPALFAATACGSSSSTPATSAPPEGGINLNTGDYVDAEAPDGAKPMVDGGYLAPDGGVLAADRFVTQVVSFTPGDCAGFGITQMPGVVLGPPVGAGAEAGGLDVVSLGYGGEIVLGFGDDAIVDGDGPDFIVFENAFFRKGTTTPNAEDAEVAVSEDGVTWKTFPCTPADPSQPQGMCAGWHPVYSAPGNGISPVDPAAAGGDLFDLKDVGLAKAKQVRIRDMKTGTCPSNPGAKPTQVGFDLDAVSIVNASSP